MVQAGSKSTDRQDYDPDTDLTKPEQGVLDVARLVSQTEEALDAVEVVDLDILNRIGSLRNQYEVVLRQQPGLVSSVAYKLDKKLRVDPLLVEIAQSEMNEMIVFEDEELEKVLRKALLVGELFIDIEDYKRAEVYLFLALKIHYALKGPDASDDKSYDTELLINTAEAVYKNIEEKHFKLIDEKDKPQRNTTGISDLTEDLYKKFITFLGPFWKHPIEEEEQNFAQLTPEERLYAASDLLYIVLAQDEKNVDAHQLLAEINLEHAGQYIIMAGRDYNRPPRSFAETDIRYVDYCFEESRRHALMSAVFEQEDEMEPPDLTLYSAASREFAAFLMKAGHTQKAINIFNSLIEKEMEVEAAKAKIVEAMIDPITYWNGVKYESPDSLQNYVKLRNTAIKYLEEIVEGLTFEASRELDEDERLLLVSAYQYLGKLALNDGSVEEVKMYIKRIREVDHPEADNWAMDLEEVLQEEIESGEMTRRN